VLIKNVVEGMGKYQGVGAGGFDYALPEAPDKVVGRVGTGFTDDLRQQMWQSPGDFVGRTARIHAQQQFPSGAYRAPALLGLHEDLPGVKQAHNHYDNGCVKQAILPSMLAGAALGAGAGAGVHGLGHLVGYKFNEDSEAPLLDSMFTGDRKSTRLNSSHNRSS
jgi:hypothetical protein